MPETKTTTITIINHDHRPYISSIDLFEIILPYSYDYYMRWVRMNITEQPQKLPKKGRDYIFCDDIKNYKRPERNKGRKRIDILLSIAFARELCYQTKTIPAEEIREFLYGFLDK